jgi:hypothetical protein
MTNNRLDAASSVTIAAGRSEFRTAARTVHEAAIHKERFPGNEYDTTTQDAFPSIGPT